MRRLPASLSAACLAALLAAPLAAAPARAATETDYTPQGFAAAQAAGRPILVDITAPWCPTCAKQRPVIARLEQAPAFADLVVFRVDFDSGKDTVRGFGARMQSTLIAFRGKEERGRSVGETDPAALRALFEKAERG